VQEENFEATFNRLSARFDQIGINGRTMNNALQDKKRQIKNLEAEQKKLLESIEKLKKENKQLKNQVYSAEDFQNSEKIAKIVSNKVKEAGGTAESKRIIEELISEIDRCITLLKEY
jgi:predicted  nucleic acid-binding Zn-ribbon protein